MAFPLWYTVFVALLALLVFYMMALSSRTRGGVLSYLAQRVIRWATADELTTFSIGTFGFALLSGKLFFSSVKFRNQDYYIHITKLTVHVNWWELEVVESHNYKDEDKSTVPCRLSIGIRGLEVVVYNNTGKWSQLANYLYKAANNTQQHSITIPPAPADPIDWSLYLDLPLMYRWFPVSHVTITQFVVMMGALHLPTTMVVHATKADIRHTAMLPASKKDQEGTPENQQSGEEQEKPEEEHSRKSVDYRKFPTVLYSTESQAEMTNLRVFFIPNTLYSRRDELKGVHDAEGDGNFLSNTLGSIKNAFVRSKKKIHGDKKKTDGADVAEDIEEHEFLSEEEEEGADGHHDDDREYYSENDDEDELFPQKNNRSTVNTDKASTAIPAAMKARAKERSREFKKFRSRWGDSHARWFMSRAEEEETIFFCDSVLMTHISDVAGPIDAVQARKYKKNVEQYGLPGDMEYPWSSRGFDVNITSTKSSNGNDFHSRTFETSSRGTGTSHTSPENQDNPEKKSQNPKQSMSSPRGASPTSRLIISCRTPTTVRYGPWSDHQRALLTTYLNPYTYQNQEVFNPVVGQPIPHDVMITYVVFEAGAQIDIPFRSAPTFAHIHNPASEAFPTPPAAESLGNCDNTR